jgi:SAM-dependent methyltransferase
MNHEQQIIPSIFMGALDYKENPEALELAQATFNEEVIYKTIAGFALDWYKSHNHIPKVLDLCSATGLSSLRVAKTIPVASVTLVDTDRKALNKCCKYFDSICPIFVHCQDAVTFQSTDHYDIIIMNSAYHHIQNDQKVSFLNNALSLISTEGAFFIGDHFLRDYNNKFEFKNSVVSFYTNLINDLLHRGESDIAINLIRQSGLYTFKEEYEYKVSLNIFKNHIEKAGLTIDVRNRLWPDNKLCINDEWGTYAIILK